MPLDGFQGEESQLQHHRGQASGEFPLLGCVAAGLAWTNWPSEDAWGVSNSRDALDAILAALGDDEEVRLTILQPILTMAGTG